MHSYYVGKESHYFIIFKEIREVHQITFKNKQIRLNAIDSFD